MPEHETAAFTEIPLGRDGFAQPEWRLPCQRAPAARPCQSASRPFDFHPLGRVIFGARRAGPARRAGARARRHARAARHRSRPRSSRPPAAGRASRCATPAWTSFVFDGVEENPTERDVDAGVGVRADARASTCIVAVGGGSSMDCAKGINFLLTNGGRMADYKGFGKATKPMLPSIGVPTTAGTGSEAQSYALIADEKTHLKMACGDQKAAFRVAILDPEVTVSQPRRSPRSPASTPSPTPSNRYVCTQRNPVSHDVRREALAAAWSRTSRRCCATRTICAARSAMQLGRLPCRAWRSRTRCSASATPAPTR